MTHEDLRAAAEKATEGEWLQFDHGGEMSPGHFFGPAYADCVWRPEGPGRGLITDCSPNGQAPTPETIGNAAYIALANPARILSILAELDRKTAALEGIAKIIELSCKKDDGPNVITTSKGVVDGEIGAEIFACFESIALAARTALESTHDR